MRHVDSFKLGSGRRQKVILIQAYSSQTNIVRDMTEAERKVWKNMQFIGTNDPASAAGLMFDIYLMPKQPIA